LCWRLPGNDNLHDRRSHLAIPQLRRPPPGTDIWALIIHTCEGKPPGDEQQSSLPWLCNPDSDVSCHYYVTREGKIYELVDDAKRAWHAGESVLNGVWYCSNYSIGVEL
jgi:N-acetylmuramoyl-L-alanine amidase